MQSRVNKMPYKKRFDGRDFEQTRPMEATVGIVPAIEIVVGVVFRRYTRFIVHIYPQSEIGMPGLLPFTSYRVSAMFGRCSTP